MAREDDFPATPLRRRLLIAGLAVATAVTLILMMLERVGAPPLPPPPPLPDAERCPLPPPPPLPDAERCAEGQDRGCLGGRAEVILVPTLPPASVPASAAVNPTP
ncbi:MAG: hypothetical protein MUF16_13975 [Burkholderiaceae bacterium]|nr:hypothetical protein [Burkholderiaceae bacterium]